MYIHNLDPTLLSLGPLEIRWYGLVYVLGFLAAAYFLQKQRQHLHLHKEEIWDLVFYIMVGVIVGARLFELFWEPSYYFANLWNIFKIWQGGMSFHGGFVGSIVGAYLYCKKKRISFLPIADVLSIPAIFALALGRIANFINGELWGRPWSGSWCVNFKNTGGGDICRHPSTLYGAVKRFLVLGGLLILGYWNKIKSNQAAEPFSSFKPGFIFWNFVFWEGLGRIIVDFYREDVLYAGFSLGQWFSAVMVVAAGYVFLKYYKDDWKKLLR